MHWTTQSQKRKSNWRRKIDFRFRNPDDATKRDLSDKAALRRPTRDMTVLHKFRLALKGNLIDHLKNNTYICVCLRIQIIATFCVCTHNSGWCIHYYILNINFYWAWTKNKLNGFRSEFQCLKRMFILRLLFVRFYFDPLSYEEMKRKILQTLFFFLLCFKFRSILVFVFKFSVNLKDIAFFDRDAHQRGTPRHCTLNWTQFDATYAISCSIHAHTHTSPLGNSNHFIVIMYLIIPLFTILSNPWILINDLKVSAAAFRPIKLFYRRK